MYGKHLVTAPNLASLVFESSYLLKFYTDLCYLEKVDVCINYRDVWNGCRVAELLQQLHNVKFLTLNLELVKMLSSYLEQISLQPSPFSNLKSLKIYPVYVPSDDESHKRVKVSTEVINYLLDGSPTATFTLISYEEIKEKQQKVQAIENAAKAQKLMAKLQVMLEQEKANIETCVDRPIEAGTLDQGN
ncbi:hypothetical protein M8C21_022429 [Ambrosia artemisiifolia]|uniref:Uncharacterized protein n=1 Tax=Ambrosia artemisiifolia TaxID=4212 RepID=A0AAD5D172_AMBAR|nr:hypothetical protein M8C21_022429 [Ambrosia artemisiifolia]